MKKILSIIPLSGIFLSSPVAIGNVGVNGQNGNMYASFRDVTSASGEPLLEHTRTYNSQSREMCMHGQWGTYVETQLMTEADGAVTVFENCNGARTRFTPQGNVNLQAAVDKILKAVEAKSGSAQSSKFKKDLAAKLKESVELRREYAQKYDVATDIPVGTKFFTNARGYQEMEKKKDFYERKNAKGHLERFSLKTGRLIEVVIDGKKTEFSYDKNNRLTKIQSSARSLSYTYRNDGKLECVESTSKQKSCYKYNADGKMVESKDAQGKVHKYSWSGDNLASITYPDNKKSAFSYDPKTQFISKVVNTDGSWVEYKYGADPRNPDLHYWTEILKGEKGSTKVVDKERFEYKMRINAEGVQKPHMIKTLVAGVETETIYAECCSSLPEKVTQKFGDDTTVTNFKYDGKGNLTSKTNNKGLSTSIKYDSLHNKISEYVINGLKTNFEYDKAGKLKRAIRKDVAIVLDYAGGNISKMVSLDKKTKKKQVLEFKYDLEGNRPGEIRVDGKALRFIYGPNGTASVDSSVKPEVALQVSEAFSKLIEVVQPTDFSMSL